MKITVLTKELLKEHIDYNPNTGVFTWIKKTNKKSRVNIGSEAGTITVHGYLSIYIGHHYRANRLAWFYVYGLWPSKGMVIDHINGIKTDNRICNLREATPQQNTFNQVKHSNNTSGYKGVYWSNVNKKWYAQGRINGKNKFLGNFINPKHASLAYENFCSKIHGEFYYAR
jgi:hypothetical protein